MLAVLAVLATNIHSFLARHTAMILVLDLSKPSELWFTLEKFLTIIRSRVDAVINEMRMQQPDIKEQLKRQTWQRIGEEHVDKDLIDPLLIPLVIVGTKYDTFQVSKCIN